MSADNVFTTGYSVISVTPNHTFRIYPLGDQHCASKNHDEERYKETLSELRKDPDGYFVMLGDEHDLASFGERKAIRAANLHESTLHDLDQRALQKCRDFVEMHKWMGDRLLFMIQGNHYWTFSSSSKSDGIEPGMSSTQWIANQLGTRWAGWLTYHRISVRRPGWKNAGKQMTVDIVASHGKAGGKLVGTAYNQVSELRGIFPGADIYLMGHDHKRGAVPDSTLHVPHSGHGCGLIVKQRRQWMVRTGSFLKGYVPNEAGYIVGRLLRPAELGNVKLDVKVARVRKDGADCISADVHCWA